MNANKRYIWAESFNASHPITKLKPGMYNPFPFMTTHIHKSTIVSSYEIRLELCQHQHPNFSVLLSSLACSACMIFDLLNAAAAFHVSSDKEQVVSVVSGMILPIYEGFRLSHYKDPYETTSNYNGKKQRFWTLLMHSASGCASKSMTT